MIGNTLDSTSSPIFLSRPNKKTREIKGAEQVTFKNPVVHLVLRQVGDFAKALWLLDPGTRASASFIVP